MPMRRCDLEPPNLQIQGWARMRIVTCTRDTEAQVSLARYNRSGISQCMTQRIQHSLLFHIHLY